MAVKGVIFDVSGTMLKIDGTAVEGIKEAIDRLRENNIIVIAMQGDFNRKQTEAKFKRLNIQVDHLLTRSDVGAAKGSRAWMDKARQLTGFENNEFIYVGDSKNDMITAVNSRVFYFNAAWSSPDYEYGIDLFTPYELVIYVLYVFNKNTYWTWSCSQNIQDVEYTFYSLLEANLKNTKGLISNEKTIIMNILKERSDSSIGRFNLGDIIIMHLLASLYLDDTIKDIDTIMFFPSRDGNRTSRFKHVLNIFGKMFRDKSKKVLYRSSPARSSAEVRNNHGEREAVLNQLNTLGLSDSIEGKTVLLIDDYLTKGISLGVGSYILRKAGAKKVICVTFGKYSDNLSLPIFDRQGDFSFETIRAPFDLTVVDGFLQSLQLIKQEP